MSGKPSAILRLIFVAEKSYIPGDECNHLLDRTSVFGILPISKHLGFMTIRLRDIGYTAFFALIPFFFLDSAR